MQGGRQCKYGMGCNKFQAGMSCGYVHSNNVNPMGGGSQTYVVPPPTFNSGGRPCKHGTNCFSWKNGTCNFNHSNPTAPVATGNPKPPMQCKFGDTCRNYQQGKCIYLHSNPGSTGPQPVQQKNPVYQNPGMVQGSFEDRVCRNWMQDKCQNQQCKRQHKFIENNSIKRICYLTEIPTEFNSNIAILKHENNLYIPVKMGKVVRFMVYSAETGKLDTVNFMHQCQSDIGFFKCEQQYLFYGFETKNTGLWNIGIFHLIQQKTYKIMNAHKKFITGITMVGDDKLISVSHDGQIKVWFFNSGKNQFEIHADLTKRFIDKFDNNNPINFGKLFKIGDQQTLWTGTNQGRLAVWNLNSMDIVANLVVPGYINLHDLEIKTFKNGMTLGLLLGWAADKSSCIMSLDLQTFQLSEQIHDKSITRFLVCDDFLACGTAHGQVYFYRLDNMEKIGVVLLHNEIIDLFYTEMQTSTLITFKHLLLLEACRNAGKDMKNGSFSLFRID